MDQASIDRFERLWVDHSPAVLRYARRRCLPDDVDDVVAETFVVAWRRLSEAPSHPLPWLLGICRNVAANVSRARRRREALYGRIMQAPRLTADPDAGDGTAGGGSDSVGRVLAALAELPNADRELLTLLAWDGLTPTEAAESLGCSRGALAVRLYRARRRLRAAMTGAEHAGVMAAIPIPKPISSGELSTVKRSDQVLNLLAANDPAGGEATEEADAARLVAIRAMVDMAARTVEPRPSTLEPSPPAGETRSVSPRGLVVGGLAATVLAVLAVLVSALLPDGARAPLSEPAIADDGQLNCGDGYAAAIPPRDADLRLLPTSLPSGWTLTRIFARDETFRGYCAPPSLTVADPDQSWPRMSVYGPFPAISIDGFGTGTPVTIVSRPGLRFDYDSATPRELHRWVWTDQSGHTWMAETWGYPLNEANTVLDAVSTEGDQVRWEPADPTSQLSVLHQRTGPPYLTDSRSLAWYVDLNGPGGPLSLQVSKTYRDDPVPLLASTSPGPFGEVTRLSGRTLILQDDEGGASPRFLAYELAPGVVVQAEIRGHPLPDVLAIISSLTDVPTDDPRLETHALNEDYG
ncbi:MAG: sigma-70 family RNA polymerase sigma factor [Sporichthyaceae bacterium]|nr:sigma-70 family RNA polymerase sigma factor [Sporichthyaceae bacterium]